jgi:hypothetical protein
MNRGFHAGTDEYIFAVIVLNNKDKVVLIDSSRATCVFRWYYFQ